jgi:hypothetical protein
VQARAARKAMLEERKALEDEKKRKAEEQGVSRASKKRAVDAGGGEGEGVPGADSDASGQNGEPVPQAFPSRSPGPIPEGRSS